MKTLTINLPNHTYPITWENDFEQLVKIVTARTAQGRHFVVTNSTLYTLYQKKINRLFVNCQILTPIQDGERYKNFTTVTQLADELLKLGANRNSTIWAFGGGVVGDISGFLASIYMRGIPFYQVPTTLLSMVDSSVGGKTGVNLDHGKNMIGTFYQPQGVYIHVNFLATLDRREFQSGLSEVIKSALLSNLEFFQFIGDHTRQLNTLRSNLPEKQISEPGDISPDHMADSAGLLEELSFRSVEVKAKIVTEDEKETGLRAILNLGHTLAHALESFYNYSHLKHGEAVAIGIVFASFLSMKKNYLKKEEFDRIQKVFTDLNLKAAWNDLPTSDSVLNTVENLDDFINLMKGDKKNTDNSIRFILLREIGKYTLPEPVDIPTIKESLIEFKKELA